MYLRSDKLYTIGTHLRGSDRCLPYFASVVRAFCLLCSGLGQMHGLAAVVVDRRPPFVFI
jgi:hypothetical protein